MILTDLGSIFIHSSLLFLESRTWISRDLVYFPLSMIYYPQNGAILFLIVFVYFSCEPHFIQTRKPSFK